MIVVGFSRRKTWNPISWMIMLIEGTGYSHTYVRIWSDSLHRWMIYQATLKGGLHFTNIDKFKENNVIVDEFKVEETSAEKTRILVKCIDYVEDNWSILQLIGILYVRVMKFFKKEVKNPWPLGWVCAEVVWEFLHDLGVEVTEDRDSVGIKLLRDTLVACVSEYKQGGRWTVFKD